MLPLNFNEEVQRYKGVVTGSTKVFYEEAQKFYEGRRIRKKGVLVLHLTISIANLPLHRINRTDKYNLFQTFIINGYLIQMNFFLCSNQDEPLMFITCVGSSYQKVGHIFLSSEMPKGVREEQPHRVPKF